MADLSDLEKVLGVEFRDIGLLRKALTHSSYVNENPRLDLESNERLEFLGDALLGYVVAQELYLVFPTLSEGQLTEARSALVRAESLTRIARRLRLGDYLHLGAGEEEGGGRRRPRNVGRALEAVIGAILLDRGLEPARAFVLAQLGEDLRRAGGEGFRKDSKSQLQELTQARWKVHPIYTAGEGQDADGTRQFVVEVLVDGRVMGRGIGPTKQAAQQYAATEALQQLIDPESGIIP